MKHLFTIIILLLVFYSSHSQDMITLKTGDQIKCHIISVDTSEIKYKKQDSTSAPAFTIDAKKVFVVNRGDGSKIVLAPFTKPTPHKNRGYTSTTIVAALIPTGGNNNYNNPLTWPGISVQSAFGLYAGNCFSFSLGAGIDEYGHVDENRDLIMLPFFAEPQLCFSKGDVTPYISFDIGYGFTLTPGETNDFYAYRGIITHPQAGVKIFMTKKAAFLFSIGYKTQFLTGETGFLSEDGGTYLKLNSLTLNTGLQF